jgi:uncharacterized membrane protein
MQATTTSDVTGRSLWDETRMSPPGGKSTLIAKHPLNVGEYERWASVLGGGSLALYGLTRGSWSGLALAALGAPLIYRGATGHCACYAALGVSTADRPHGPLGSVAAGHGVKVEKAIAIKRPPKELYRFWRNLENLPRVMSHLKSVRFVDERRSHWVAKGPLGTKVEWDAEIYTERPDELLSWRSLEGASVDTAGSVHFTKAPGRGGTDVRVALKYNPPGDKLGATLAKLFGKAPEQQIEEDLLRFKQRMEGTDRSKWRQ